MTNSGAVAYKSFMAKYFLVLPDFGHSNMNEIRITLNNLVFVSVTRWRIEEN